jgi:hypothetical protein
MVSGLCVRPECCWYHLPAGTPDSREVENAIWDAINEDPDYDPVAWLARAG